MGAVFSYTDQRLAKQVVVSLVMAFSICSVIVKVIHFIKNFIQE